MSRQRPRQLVLLVWPTVRAMQWLGPGIGAALALAVQRVAGEQAPGLALEFAAIALALGVAFALDDPAASTLVASPVSLAMRNGVRAACALPVPALVWLVLVLRSRVPDTSTLTVELAGMCATVLAIAACAARAGESGGSVAAPALLGLLAASQLFPSSTALLLAAAPPSASTSIAGRWAGVLGVAAAMWVAASVDPAGNSR